MKLNDYAKLMQIRGSEIAHIDSHPSHEARFKAVIQAIIDAGIHPGPLAIGYALPNKIGNVRNLNGRESKWRREVLEANGFVQGESTGGHAGYWRKVA